MSSKQLDDKELLNLLIEVLKKAFEHDKEKQQDIQNIASLAVDMVKNMAESDKDQLTSRDGLKYKKPETMLLLKDTLTAAVAGNDYLKLKKHNIHNLMDQHKKLGMDLAKLKPGSPEYEKLKKDMKLLQAQLRKELKELNKMDSNPERREKFDKELDKDDFMDKFQDVKTNVSKMTPTMKSGAPLSGAEDKALTDSLINLFGMDPRVAGSGVSVVMSVVGNEMEIPDAYPAYTAFEPLHALSGDIRSNAGEAHQASKDSSLNETTKETAERYSPPESSSAKEPDNKAEIAGKLEEAVHSTLDSDHGKTLTHSSPSLKRE